MVRKLIWIFAAALPLTLGVACGGGHSAASAANVKASPLPEGKEWKGVYYSQVYGNLHLVVEGDTAKGKWRTVAGDAWGELEGKIDGDLLHYEWTEHKIGLVGPSATRKGKGYFKYVSNTAGTKDPDEIQGEWGLGENEVGNTWKAVRQANQEPEPNSVMPDEVERSGTSVGGGWDEGASGESKPESK